MRQIESLVNNAEIMSTTLDYWLDHHRPQSESAGNPSLSSYIAADPTKFDQSLYVCAEESLHKLVDICDRHGCHCSDQLHVRKLHYNGHVGILRLACSKSSHNFTWSLSPYTGNKKHLVNQCIMHRFACSGMLPSHYMRFV